MLLEDSIVIFAAEISIKEYLQITGELVILANCDSSENLLDNRLALRAHNAIGSKTTLGIVRVEVEITAPTALALEITQTSMVFFLLRRSLMNNERSTAAIWQRWDAIDVM
jgi:hypothetical protein